MENLTPAVAAINPKLQSKVNRVLKLNNQYDALNDERCELEEKYSEGKVVNAINRKCSDKFEKLHEAWYGLPQRERANIKKYISILPI